MEKNTTVYMEGAGSPPEGLMGHTGEWCIAVHSSHGFCWLELSTATFDALPTASRLILGCTT